MCKRLILATADTRMFTYTRFHIPRAPTAPALAPAAGASPGGLEGKLGTELLRTVKSTVTSVKTVKPGSSALESLDPYV